MVEIVTQAKAEEIAAGDEEVIAPVVVPVEEVIATKEEEKDWDDLLEEDAEEELAVVPEETPEPVPEEVKKEEVPAEVVPEEKDPEETPAEEPTPDTPPDVVVPETVNPEDTRTPEEVQKEISKARDLAREDLVDKFTWTEEQADAFSEDPGAVMSELAADLFLDIFDSVSQGLRSQMPGMVQGIMSQQTAQAQHDQQFFNAWPQLAKAEYRETIDRIAGAYMQQNPTIDAETAQKEIGAQAWVALRLPLDQLLAQTKGESAPVQTPVLVPQSHVPANAGNTVQAAKAPVAAGQNEYEQLADELLTEDM